jgi:superfamily II DNA/RNA helicase
VSDDSVTTPEPDQQSFADLGLDERVVRALKDIGYETPSPIQAATIPALLEGRHVVGLAQTGTGKTAAFALPILSRLDVKQKLPQALILAPTRELALQVCEAIEKYAARMPNVKVLPVYGGQGYGVQLSALRRGVHIVVGTPGRIMDHLDKGTLDLSQLRFLVLDEADEMLDLGFLPDVEKIMAMTSPARHTMLFSATMPGAIVALARRYMTQPTHIRAMSEDGEADSHTVKATEQFVYRAHAMDKVEMVSRILQAEGRGLTIIFSRTKRTAAKVADELVDRGFAAASLHGDLGQGAREQALRAFRNGKVDVLVATDVAARGIDVTNVTHVINYQCPDDEKTYVHRIGRTGRAGNTGIAVTFVDWDDETKWAVINRQLDLGIPSATETYSSSPHLFTDLDIPEGTKGRLPRTQRTREGLDAEQIEDLGETGKSSGRRQSSRGGSGGGRDGGRGGRDGGRGSRDGGGRDAERSGNRDSERSSDQPSEAKGDGEGRPRRRRNRRRTHGGQSDQVQDAG